MTLPYASELGKEGTLVISNWRPIPHEKFIEMLHDYSCSKADQHGYDGIKHVSAMRSDKRSTVSIYYIPKRGDHTLPIYTPVLLVMHTKPESGSGSKIICFEFIPYEETGNR